MLGCFAMIVTTVTYPKIFWGYHLYSESLFKCHVKSTSMVEADGLKNFEFNTSTLLEKAFKAFPSHFKFKQIFAFFSLFFGRGTRVWVPISHLPYQNPTRYVAELQYKIRKKKAFSHKQITRHFIEFQRIKTFQKLCQGVGFQRFH